MFKFFLGSIFTLMILAGLTLGSENLAQSRTPKPTPQVEIEKPDSQIEKNILPTHKHTADCDKTTAEPVQIICILDRSGSMRSLAEDTIGGYNSFLEKQRQTPGEVEVTTVLFDDQYEKIADTVNLNEIPELTSAEYYARGTTALLDAVGRTIMDIAGKMEKEKICPEKRCVLFLIMTDGLENASVEYNKAAVKSMIESTTENYKWNYIFMGANMDSVSEAGSLGISGRHAVNFAASSEGVRKTFEDMDAAASEVRESGTVSEDWNK